jgi:Bacterial Ig-like domain (group 1)/RTX calcium-binding nonapeptide repeat (4 copies)
MADRLRIKLVAVAATVALGAVFLPLASPALANHPDACLDVTPESSSGSIGTTHTLTATLRSLAGSGAGCTQAAVNATNGAVAIDFEITGPNDPDGGDTPGTPDRTCTIAAGTSSCTVSYPGSAAGTDTVRAWIDHDASNATVEADTAETRCANSQGDEAGCAPANSGTIGEPDITDVVQRTWSSTLPATRLDCTPETGTERIGTAHVITCTARDANDNPVAGVEIDAEANGENDPDGPDALTSPDFTCTTNASGTCTFTHSGATTEGTTTYRAWIDADKSNTTAEADTTEGQPSSSAPGATAEPDATDVVTNQWTGAGATLDCDDSSGTDTERETNPATGAADATSRETYTCTVRDAQGRTVVTATTVKGEVMNGVNDPDATDGASLDSPDYTCTTTNGVCTITVTQAESETGTATVCFWVGTTSEGQALCASEPTGESQATNGSDTGNDLADQVELTWARATTAVRLDCAPEAVSNNVSTSDAITCTARDSSNAVVSGANVDVEATGANDPDNGNTPASPDFTCTTNASGTCTFTHTGGTTPGTTTYRAWIDVDGSNASVEADTTEARDETATPGATAEPDLTDVVAKTWVGPPSKVTITPTADSGSVGTCNAFTLTLTDAADNPLGNRILDVEQVHQLATNATANDEPAVAFCLPAAGPNVSGVETSRGDRVENPDNLGTAGGEVAIATNAAGQVTIGITVQTANGAPGTGTVALTAWFETSDNDDPDTSEPRATATKTWITPQGRTIVCVQAQSSHATGAEHTVTCTVRDRFGEPIAGEGVTFTESGPGDLVSTAAQTTNASGQVTATFTSFDPGAQTITATITDDLQGAEPAEVDDCDRAAGDPSGAPAGVCASSLTHTWTQATPFRVEMTPDESESRPGVNQTYTITVTDASGAPIAGVRLALVLGGQGTIFGETPATNAQGQTQITITSEEPGNTTLGVSTTACAAGGDCIDESVHHWGPAVCDVFGTNGNDVLQGTSAGEVICGFGGRDQLVGGDGDDTLLGGNGVDALKGGTGNDRARGGGGRDVVNGGSGVDFVAGGAGADRLDGDGGDDHLTGGSGRDDINGGPGFDVCRGGAGRDRERNCEA